MKRFIISIFFIIVGLFLFGCDTTIIEQQKFEFHYSVEGGNGVLEPTYANSFISNNCKSIDSTCKLDCGENSYNISFLHESNESYEIEFTAKPDKGYQVKEWLYNGKVVENFKDNLYVASVSAAENYICKISVVFEEVECDHIFGEGQKCDDKQDLYIIEYTCEICGLKKQELVIYSIIVNDESDSLINELPKEACPDNKITIQTKKYDDYDIEVYVNNTQIEQVVSNKVKDSLIFEFVMPHEAVEIVIKKILLDYYTVIFNSNDGIYVSGNENQSVNRIEKIVYPVYEKKGHTLKDYNIIKNDETKQIIVDIIWERNPYIFELKVFIEDELYYCNYYKYNEEIFLELPTKEGYCLEADEEMPSRMTGYDLAIYYKWDYEKVILTINYGYKTDRVKYYIGEIVEEPELEEHKYRGYSFEGWDREFPFEITEDTAVKAILVPYTSHLKFDSKGADYLEFDELYIETDQMLVFPKVKKEGFSFNGWYYNNVKYKEERWDEAHPVDIVLEAEWEYDLEYYEFGKYPQSHVSDVTLIEELNKLDIVNEQGYYEYNGEEYCKIEAAPVVENALYYSDGKIVVKGVEWFKVEPIKWSVTGVNRFTLKPLYLLDSTYFDLSGQGYLESDIRKYLLNDFYNAAFTEEEQQLLVACSNTISGYVDKDNVLTIFHTTVHDKVILVDGYDGAEMLTLTDYAIARGAVVCAIRDKTTNETTYYGDWWVFNQTSYKDDISIQAYFSASDGKFVSSVGNIIGVCINVEIYLDL